MSISNEPSAKEMLAKWTEQKLGIADKLGLLRSKLANLQHEEEQASYFAIVDSAREPEVKALRKQIADVQAEIAKAEASLQYVSGHVRRAEGERLKEELVEVKAEFTATGARVADLQAQDHKLRQRFAEVSRELQTASVAHDAAFRRASEIRRQIAEREQSSIAA